MASKSVKVILEAVTSGFRAEMLRASKSVQDFNAQLSKKGQTQGWKDASSTLLKFGVVAAGAAALAVKSFADFDQSMSAVAATGEDARANMEALRAAAIKAGADTKYSATEAAAGMESLMKAGVSAKDVLGGGLTGALNLAASGNMSVADSAEVAATAMTQFNLVGTDVPHIADLIAAAAGKAQGDVSDMSLALKQSGLVAAQAGLSLEQTTGTLAAFASAGLIGSDAGTSFRTMLLALMAPSKQAAAVMAEYGLSAYNASGDMVTTADLAEQLKTKMGNLAPAQRDAALAIIFGSDAIRAANVLYQQGKQGIDAWTASVNDQGYAARTAATRMGNLKGDLEQLRGSFETLLISAGSGANGPLRTIVKSLTDLTNVAGRHSGTAQALVGISGGLGAVALAAGGLMKGVTVVSEFQSAVKGLGLSMKTIGLAGGAVGLAIGVATTALGLWMQKNQESKARVAELTDIIREQNTVIGDNSQKWAAKALQDSGALDAAQKMGISLSDVTQAALGNADAQKRVNDQTDLYLQRAGTYQAVVGGQVVTQQAGTVEAGKLRAALGGLSGETDQATASARQMALATGATGLAMDVLKGVHMGPLKSETQKTADAMTALNDALQTNADLALAASGSELGYQQALMDAHQAAKDNGRTTADNTTKGLANQQALLAQANAARTYLADQEKLTGNTDELAKKTQQSRDDFIATARQMGVSATEAQKLADKYGLIPKDKSTRVSSPGATGTKQQIDALNTAIGKLPKDKQTEIRSIWNALGYQQAKKALDSLTNKTVWIDTVYQTRSVQKAGQAAPHVATGGRIRGPGTATSDSIHAMLSDGEYVVRASSTARNLRVLEFINSGGVIPGYASGGYVAAQSPVQSALSVDQSGIEQAMVRAMSGLVLTIDGRAVDWRIDRKLATVASGVRRA